MRDSQQADLIGRSLLVAQLLAEASNVRPGDALTEHLTPSSLKEPSSLAVSAIES